MARPTPRRSTRRPGRRRQAWVAAVLGLVLAATAGCAQRGTGRGPGSAPSAREPSGRADPLALVGRWHVEATGAAPGTALLLGEGLSVFLPCGVVDGAWAADGPQRLFLADVSSGDSACWLSGQAPALPWLRRAVRFDTGAQPALLDRDGAVVARLRPGATPTVGPDRDAALAAAPRLTPALRALLGDAAPLPAGARPAGLDDLQRAWVPTARARPEAGASFASDGSWTGSDGCNGGAGRYVVGREGRLLATGGPQTLIGCENVPVPGWVTGAVRVGLVGPTLVLYGRGGEELGRLARR